MKRKWLTLFAMGVVMLLSAQSYDDVFRKANRMRMYGNDSAFIFIDHAIELADDLDKEMYTRVVKGDFFNRFDSLDGGILYIKNLFDLYREKLPPQMESKAYCILAGLYGRKNDFQKEIEMAQKGLELAEAAKDTQALYTSNFHMMMGFDNAGNLKASNQYGFEAFDWSIHRNIFSLQQVAFYLFSNNRDRLTEEPFATYLYKYLDITNPNELPKDGTHAGFEYLDQFKLNLDEWRMLLGKALGEGKNYSAMRVGNKLGLMLVDTGQYQSAVNILKPTLDLAYQENSMLEVRYSLSLLQRAYEAMGNDHMALKNLKAFYHMRDSLQGIDIRKNADSLYIKFQTAQKDHELAEQQIKILESQRQRNILLFSLVGVLMLTGLSFYVIRKRQQFKNQLAQKENLLKVQEIDQLKQKQKIVALDYMLMGEEKERSRIAQDLHDSLGSLLTSAKNQMQQLLTEIDVLKNQLPFGRADELIRQASVEVRRISHDMMPNALSSIGLQAAVEDLADQSNIPGKLSIKTHFFDLDESRLSDAQKVGLYRIIQELTHNVIKHADANSLIIQISQEDHLISLVVEDNGKGFDPADPAIQKGIGLKNIESRIEYLNGNIEINSKPEGPTTFVIEIPRV